MILVNGTIGSATTVDLADLATGSATQGAGNDYTFTSPQSITIPAGSYDGLIGTAITIANPNLPVILDDVDSEGPETIDFTLNNAGANVTIGDANGDTTTQTTTVYTITDNDPVLVELLAATSVDPITGVGSTDESGTADNFPTLRILGEVTTQGTVDLVDTAAGTATAGGTDYLFNTQTITIPVGSYDGTTATQIVITGPTITQDTDVEGSETITFQLQNPVNVTIGDADADTATEDDLTYTITDDDGNGLTVAFDSATYSQAEAGGNLTLNLTVSGADTTALLAETATLAFTDVEATDGVDFDSIGLTTVNIPNADYTTPQTIAVNVPLTDDALLEGDETFTVAITGVGDENALGSAVGGQSSTTATITEDETASVQFSATTSNTAGDEDGAVTVDVALALTSTTGVAALATGETITVQAAYSGSSTATNGAGEDINFSTPETITFTDADANGAISSLTFTLTDDAIDEADETAVFDITLAGAGTLNAATGVSLGANTTHTLTINDDDTVTVDFLAASSSFGDTAGTNNIIVTLSGPADQNVDIEFTTSGTAVAGTDFTDFTSGTPDLTITAGQTTAVLPVAILTEATVDGNKSLVIDIDTVSPAASAVEGSTINQHTVTITDDESGASFLNYTTATFAEDAANEGEILNTIDLTLTGDTFTVTGGAMTEGVHFNVVNPVAGLTVAIAGTSATTATFDLTGTAAASTNADDIDDLGITFLDAAFGTGPANTITNYNKSDFIVDYSDPTGAGAAI
ncbi:MAG: Calx-beta domain-containing protein, partial [Cyanobacteria bacterium P01_A01_bin.37]